MAFSSILPMERTITSVRPCAFMAPHRFNRRQRLCLANASSKQRASVIDKIGDFSELPDERPSTYASRVDASRVLFDQSHVVAWSPELALYAPLGVLLGGFRSLLWILGIYLDQPWFRKQSVVDAYLRLLGVSVIWKNPQRIPAERHLMVSNHCSVGDLMMLFSHPTLPQRYTHLVTSALPARVTQSHNLPVILRPASPTVYDELASRPESGSVHLFPEGGMTNGHGMLRFSRGFTRIMQRSQPQQQQQGQHGYSSSRPDSSSDDGAMLTASTGPGTTLPVVPVALRVRSSLQGVSSHTLTSPFLANLFWFSFSPSTTLEATVLPAMVPLPGEARGAFVNRVQAAIAEELGVKVFDMTIQQKRALVKAAEAAAKRQR